MKAAFAMLFVLVTAVVALFFWGRSDVTVPESDRAATSDPAEDVFVTSDTVETPDGGVIERFPASDFSLPKLGGGTISLSEYRDKKPVVLLFWATWCPNCRRDMPVLDGIYRKYGDSVEIIGIDLNEKEATVRAFIDKNAIGFPIAFDEDGTVGDEYGIQYTNTHVLVGKNGDVEDLILGDLSEEALREWLGI